ncbi:MAG: three-Cys-motif partner protein TcmP [Pseudomonadota bacterium]
MTRVQRFGGVHTQQKLDAVAAYLQAYVTVMQKQRFKLSYVDGFAGSGASQAVSAEEEAQLLEANLYDSGAIVEGSPIRALNIDPPFDRYLFIDADPENVASLQSLAHQYSGMNMT